MLTQKMTPPFLRACLSAFGLCAMASSGIAPAYGNPLISVDVQTLSIYEQQDAFHKWYPASLTKMMTAYTVFRALKNGEVRLDTPVVMSKNAVNQKPSKMPFRVGDRLTLDDALKIMLVKSANDVSVAISETVGGSEKAFIDRMNAEAARIGMSSSHFINPNGLPGAGQYTTARDLAVLAITIKREFPQYGGYFSLEGFSTLGKTYTNYNLLIGRYDGADGMKTGFICASGFNQVTSATRNGRSIVTVVLGTDSLGARADESARMLEEGLTTRPKTRLALNTLRPDPLTPPGVADISADICSTKGRKVRSEGRDEAGRMKLMSPYIHEAAAVPNVVPIQLLTPVPGSPASMPVQAAKPKKKAKTKKK
ncbi:MAG: D-alanyl-D-alanine carboxypeptidase DacC [Pseudomonadota bacterium]